jgi:hypothetical protein
MQVRQVLTEVRPLQKVVVVIRVAVVALQVDLVELVEHTLKFCARAYLLQLLRVVVVVVVGPVARVVVVEVQLFLLVS